MPTQSNTTADQTISELASARALSALCGGSGVGQAPEPPQRAERAEPSTANLQQPTPKRGENAKIPKPQNPKTPKTEKPKTGNEFPKTKFKIPKLSINFQKFLQHAARFVSYACLILALAGFGFTYLPVIRAEAGYRLKNLRIYEFTNFENKNQNVKILPKTSTDEFADVKFVSDISIAIPKIDAYAEIIPNVDPSNDGEYMAALQSGVAHAKGTALPGQVGNSYLFAHSAGNIFDIARFNAVFYLIEKLEKGDEIYVKFGSQKFKYTVVGKREVTPSEVGFLTRDLEKIRKEGLGEIEGIGERDRVLTLQTCVPPGTDWKRLLVFAKIQKFLLLDKSGIKGDN